MIGRPWLAVAAILLTNQLVVKNEIAR